MHADSIILKQFERIAARPWPNGWEALVSSPIGRGGIGLALLSDIDQRELTKNARDSTISVGKEILDLDRINGQIANLLSSVLEAVQSRPQPAETLVRARELSAVGSSNRSLIFTESFAALNASAYLNSYL